MLAGAGASVAPPSGLPTASRFLQAFYDACLPASCDRSLFSVAHVDLRFEAVLGVVQTRFDPQLEILRVFSAARPNFNHKCLDALARCGGLVLTTNFDTLIETARPDLPPLCVRVLPEHFAGLRPRVGRGEIWHLHGALSDPWTGIGWSSSITASIRDAWKSKELFRLDHGKGAALAQALGGRDLVVLGYSGADDYDIAPALEEIQSSCRVLWVEHTPRRSPGDRSLMTPWVADYTPDGFTWYRSPALNSLATMIDSGARKTDRVHVIASDTTDLLLRLVERAGKHAPQATSDSLPSAGPGKELAEYFHGWGDRFLGAELAPYLLAVLLCRLAGLEDESRRLLAECVPLIGRTFESEEFDPDRLRLAIELSALAADVHPERWSPSTDLEEWRKELADHPVLLAWALTSAGRGHLHHGHPGQAVAAFRESLEIRRSVSSAEGAEMAEFDLARALFEEGYRSGQMNEVAAQVGRALEAAAAVPNPEGVARARLLSARIHERVGDDEGARRAYEAAHEAAMRTGLEGLIAETQGELGLCLWTRVSMRRIEKLVKTEDIRGLLRLLGTSLDAGTVDLLDEDRHDCQRAATLLAAAFRVHSRRREWAALAVVAGNLSECLAALGDGHRSLLADCSVYFCSFKLGSEAAREATDMALGRILAGTRRELPDVDLAGLEGEQLVRAVQRELLRHDCLI